MDIPQLDLSRQYEEIGPELEEAALRVMRSGRYILGPEVEAFEEEAASWIGSGFAIGLSSGTDALLAALMALEVGPEDEVVVPTYSFFATAGCVARLGARPVFVDVGDEDLCMAPDQVARALTERTKAVICVHLFGRCADTRTLRKLCDTAGIPLVEDAAQAIGARDGGRPAGTLGRLACFSFFPSKNLGALGDGGMVTTDDPDLARRIRRLRNHGQETAYEHLEVGGNFRLDALQAAFLRVKLGRLEDWIEGRRRAAERYRSLFSAEGLDGLLRAPRDEPDRHVYHQFVVRVPADRRDPCLEALREAGIGHNVYYRVPFHRQPCFGPVPGNFEVADRASLESIALPIFPELREEEQVHIARTLARALGA